ncbi:uncharacterized protein MONBRDRAFT_18255 [Monosiga brevicollis MX1]|uniref:Protein arginine N-methyltransferase domain-containing protein n=1 Tax=Monosiga brevicollis TaxID=81824 RepID=A9UV85_MONBE|nr:uncharacterized protein MONBRDRAFT_18255 [Monosiga brevicollis MX1]EDQ90850.1 predicted protein [Monosiga brevicollis MX1]|eukprot:XP_001744147.1 hypothetical protein [Monosiga brevicollis MX1]
MAAQPKWFPPGADCDANQAELFGRDLEEHFELPERLADKSASLVEAVNDFHYAMLNDHERNEFYRRALAEQIQPSDIVLEIGTGSGLLAMLAAKAGARHVYAIEANRHMAQLAQHIISVNGLADRITVINALSTEVTVEHLGGQRADALVSEILGTLLLGESALQYISDARERLLKPDARIIPAGGRQLISLVESEDIKSITSVQSWGDLDLRAFNVLQDTVSLVFTKQYGFRFSSTKHKMIVSKATVADVDFHTDGEGALPLEMTVELTAECDGRVDAVLTYWEAYDSREKTSVMSTEPSATEGNFARDMQWGQAIQLVEEATETGPQPFHVKKGDKLELVVRFSEDSAVMQFSLQRA